MACCPIHNHSEFSAIDGLSKCSEIVARAKEIEVPYIGLTDHGVVAGHLEFSKACEKGGIKPIFGLFSRFSDDRRGVEESLANERRRSTGRSFLPRR
jgi:DNA polymerase III alpha subunit